MSADHPTGICQLCGEQMPCEEVLMHLHDEHQINVTLRCWPDGSPVIVDQTLTPEELHAVKRSKALARRTPLRRSGSLARGGTLRRRTLLARQRPDRDWSGPLAKVEAEGACRNCGAALPGTRLEAAHTIGRAYDRPAREDPEGPLVVRAIDTVPLCGLCHDLYDARRLDLLPVLTHDEMAAAVQHVGIMRALRRLSGGAVGAVA